jgi:hypothetical protein
MPHVKSGHRTRSQSQGTDVRLGTFSPTIVVLYFLTTSSHGKDPLLLALQIRSPDA